MHQLFFGVFGECILSICACCYMWHLFGVTVFHRCIVNWSGGICILSTYAFCYICNLFGVMVFQRTIVDCSGVGRCILCICEFCYMWHLGGVQYSLDLLLIGVEWVLDVILVYVHYAYMCSLHGVMVFQRSIVYWRGARCILSICLFCYMWHLSGVILF